MKIISLIVSILIILESCTYNISMVDTHGQASDVIDSNQSADADVKPNISLPNAVY